MNFLRKLTKLWFVFVVVSASISCSFKQQQALFENNSSINPIGNKTVSTPIYKIKSEDLLQIRNLQNRKYIIAEPALSTASSGVGSSDSGQTYQVDDDGIVTLPILGDVKVAGLTRMEATNQIEALYSKELKDPIIELKIVNLKVTMLGEINNQGIYNLVKDHTSLIEIIGEAGGLTEKADSKKIKIIRGDMHAPQVFEVDLSDVKTLADSRIVLENNDVIYISQNRRTIRKEKLQSMSAVLQPVITLLNTALIIYTLTR